MRVRRTDTLMDGDGESGHWGKRNTKFWSKFKKNCILYFETVHFSKSLRFCYLNICKSYCKTFFYAIINIIVYEIYVFVFSVLKRAGECQIERLRHAYVLILPLLFCSAVSSFCFVFPPTFFFPLFVICGVSFKCPLLYCGCYFCCCFY